MKNAIFALSILVLASTLGAAQASAPATPSKKSTPTATQKSKRANSGTPAPAPTPANSPASAASEPSNASGLSREMIIAYLNRMFGYNENITFNVASVAPAEAPGLSDVTVIANTPAGQQQMRFYVTPDNQHVVVGELLPFSADPYKDKRDKLKAGVFGPSKGPADSPMLIVEFADLQCPACKQAVPTIERLQTDFPQIRFVFQNFPLEKLHPWAMKGAQYLDCIQRKSNDDALTFIQAVFTHQGEITEQNVTEKLNNYAKMANADPTEISACAAKPETQERVNRSLQLGRDLGMTGTPTVYVNGRPVQALRAEDYETLKALVQFELNEAKKTAGQ